MPPLFWQELLQLQGSSEDRKPVFAYRNQNKAEHLHRYQVDRIVKAAAVRAGITQKISPNRKLPTAY